MRIRSLYLAALSCFVAMAVLAADPGLEGTWSTDGVAGFVAAKEAGKSTNGLPEAVSIKFKVDTKKNKVTGTIDQMNSGKKFDVEDGKLMDKTFTFNSVESGNNQAKPIAWKGELTDANTISLTRVPAEGQQAPKPLVLHRATKK
jgi:hypothetical protein